mgnify:CR=1 FL=1
MKLTYETPTLKNFHLSPERCLMASGENLTRRTYGSEESESADGFWD